LSALIDIIGSFLIGAILLLVSAKAMDSSVQQFVNQNADAIVQNDLTTLTQILQFDLRKMGFGIPEGMSETILQRAEAGRLRFLANLNADDAIPDTIEYSVARCDTVVFVDTSIVLYGLYRRVRIAGQAASSSQIGTISNPSVFRYLDQAGAQAMIMESTRMVEVTLVVMNPRIYASDEVFHAANPVARMRELRKLIRESFWRQTRVISRNLRR
jgi:hypothetical protein